MDIRETTCCGMYEIDGVAHFDVNTRPIRWLKSFADRIDDLAGEDSDWDADNHPSGQENGWIIPALFVFSDNDSVGGGVKFVEYIREHHLGRVSSTKWVTNPNTGNKICAWIWWVNRDNLAKHLIDVTGNKEFHK